MIEYKMLRVNAETYKQLKQLALNLDVPLTRLIDKLLSEYLSQKQKADN